MAAAHVQLLATYSTSGPGSETTVLSPSSKTVTAGNIIVVGWICSQDITPTGVTDNLGNTYARIERKYRTNTMGDLWYAPVTVGGSITAITIAHASRTYRMAIASEFSGAGTLAEVGGGLTGTASPVVWVDSKAIPANGLAVGLAASSWNARTFTVGDASGSPSTSISESGKLNDTVNGQTIGLYYALAGASAVTTFTGSTKMNSDTEWAGCGGLFNPPALLKTVNGLAVASVKTLRSGLVIASGKTWNGLA